MLVWRPFSPHPPLPCRDGAHARNDMQQGHDQPGDGEGKRPPGEAERERTAADPLEVDFHSSHEQHGGNAGRLHGRQKGIRSDP